MADPFITVSGAGGSRRIESGRSLTFGRVPDEGSVSSEDHLGLAADPSLHARAGTITADGSGWVLANTGRWLRLRVIQLDGPARAEVEPGRSLRVPWSRSRVEVATGTAVVGLDVESSVGDDQAVLATVSGTTVGAFGLDRTTGYFRALVALCEPRLRDPRSDEVATAGEIARRLNRLPAEADRVTAKAVERRLAHARRRVGVGGADSEGVSAAGLEVRDAARQLADLVIRTGAVTLADLALLDPVGLGPER